MSHSSTFHLDRPVATGDARAARVDQLYGKGSSDDPACWAMAIGEHQICQPDGSMYEYSPWPRPPRDERT